MAGSVTCSTVTQALGIKTARMGVPAASTALPPIVPTDLSLNDPLRKFERNCSRFGKGNDVSWNRREIVFFLDRQSVEINSADLRRQSANLSHEQFYAGHGIHPQLA
jgi:hypothetical protein